MKRKAWSVISSSMVSIRSDHALRFNVGPEMHGGGVVPEEEGLIRFVSLVDETQSVVGYFVVDGLHQIGPRFAFQRGSGNAWRWCCTRGRRAYPLCEPRR